MHSKTYQKLDSLTEQEIFNIVINHLKEQKEQSSCTITGSCYYKLVTDEKTLKCAVGVLIEDEDYHENLEGKSIHNEIVRSLVPKRHSELLSKLQGYHDNISYESYISGEKILKETLEDYLYHVKEPNFKSLIEEYFNQYPE